MLLSEMKLRDGVDKNFLNKPKYNVVKEGLDKNKKMLKTKYHMLADQLIIRLLK